MYRQDVERLQAGQVLAKTLYTSNGDVLLAAGTALAPAYIEGLRRWGVAAVYVRDGLSDDVVPVDVVSDEVRATTAGHVQRVFESITSLGQEHAADGRPAGVDAAMQRLGPGQLSVDDAGAQAIAAMYADVEALITEILDSNAVSSLESLKTHSTYTFQHSVDVAVMGVLLGARAGLGHEALRELALGCLLHDVGKMYIDVAIIEKPDALTPAEFAEVKKHPLMGFELVRRMPVFSILPAHVAYQHHERQDGGGYPRGLEGANRVQRTSHERLDARRIVLIAEIAAVADVYSALSSDRPYRSALPLDQVAAVLGRMAGPHLNREVVQLLLRSVPMFPVGYWVEVLVGRWAGWRGVVTAAHPEAFDRPTVRLVLNAQGESLIDPVELDLREELDVEIASLAPGVSPFTAPVAT